jgi:hypothetical protein
MKVRAVLLAGVFLATVSPAFAETVFVKYRGELDLSPFICESINRSSLVRRICYDAENRYMLISLNGTYYHYCNIGSETVGGLLSADSMGRFYNATIRSRFDCRIHLPPSYK